MKALLQVTIILAISLLGEILAALIPLPIPASIYGMILMLIALVTHILPLERVRTAGKFMIEIMPVMFIPAAVGLMVSGEALKEMLLPCLIALVPVTLIVMGASGYVTQRVMRSSEKRKEESK